MITRRMASGAAALAATALLVAGLPAAFAQSPSAMAPAGPPLKVVGAFATPIEEPWDGVIDSALKAAAAAGTIDYTFRRTSATTGTWSACCARSRLSRRP